MPFGISFCTPTQVYEFAPTRSIGRAESPESSSDNIQLKINEVAKRITLPPHGVTFPTSSTSLTNTYLLFECLNIIPCVDTHIRSFTIAIDKELVRYVSAFRKLGEDRLSAWERGLLLQGIFGDEILPTTALATVNDCTIDTPGFTPKSATAPGITIKDQPYIETIQRWILRETAYVRVAAAKKGYPQVPRSIEETEWYASLVSGTVRAFVFAVRSLVEGKYDTGIDAQCATILASGRDKQDRIFGSDYDQMFS